MLDRALRHLAESVRRVDRIAALEHRLADLLRELFEAVAPRAGYALIHGELGTDHVLVDDHDEPVLIDIEGVMFLDVEWEHAFLELRLLDGDFPDRVFMRDIADHASDRLLSRLGRDHAR
ncbi:hypothetical protein [Micromonospora sp. DT47]|uniref:hypothetical protein n=1 Tax=Micromonospora sp. DT47 TaxID=3393431 RepID=UPI003CF7107C